MGGTGVVARGGAEARVEGPHLPAATPTLHDATPTLTKGPHLPAATPTLHRRYTDADEGAIACTAHPQVFSVSWVVLSGHWQAISSVKHPQVFATATLSSSLLLLLSRFMYQRAVSISPLSLTIPYLAFTPAILIATAYIFLGGCTCDGQGGRGSGTHEACCAPSARPSEPRRTAPFLVSAKASCPAPAALQACAWWRWAGTCST